MIEIEFAPALIFIEPEVWRDEFGRDTALSLLLDYLDEVEKLSVVSVLWSDQMEELLWSDPPLPPWRQDRDWKLKLVPVVATKFHKVLKFINVSTNCSQDGFVPPGSLTSVREDITRAFCCLSHEAATETEEMILCIERPEDEQPPISFQCDACALDATVRSIESPLALGRDRAVAAEFWRHAQATSPTKIDHLLALTMHWQQAENANARYRASYSQRFVESLASADNKQAIFEALAKRVLKTEEEAKHDHGLHDEPVRGKEKEGLRRFRVSLTERIHYDYPAAQQIRFVEYFPEGHHDDGL